MTTKKSLHKLCLELDTEIANQKEQTSKAVPSDFVKLMVATYGRGYKQTEE